MGLLAQNSACYTLHAPLEKLSSALTEAEEYYGEKKNYVYVIDENCIGACRNDV
jgi:hypothetical protein